MAMLRKQEQQQIAAVRARWSSFPRPPPEQRALDPYLTCIANIKEAVEDGRAKLKESGEDLKAKLKFAGVLPKEGFVGWDMAVSPDTVTGHPTSADLWV